MVRGSGGGLGRLRLSATTGGTQTPTTLSLTQANKTTLHEMLAVPRRLGHFAGNALPEKEHLASSATAQ